MITEERTITINRRKSSLIYFVTNYNSLFFLFLLVIVSSIISNAFFSFTNITNLLKTSVVYGIMAFGFTLCIISGSIDLSLGYNLAITAVIATIFVRDYNYIWAVIMCLIVGTLVGLVNGFFIGILGANSVIVTLGMTSVLYALGVQTSGGNMILGDVRSPFSLIGRGKIYNIPYQIFIFILLFFILNILLNKTRFGKYIYAVGGDEAISWVAGIKTGNVRLTVFIIAGFCAAVAGMIFASRNESAVISGGAYWQNQFDAVTAVVVGGGSISGGRGSLVKTLLGILILAFLRNLLN
ncbi:MAG: ABC transporter permease, partial [Actinobacteria bacterium]|nr:ABC transporter permease [Actinomycetota bacterium]